jgi:hypothetical protein
MVCASRVKGEREGKEVGGGRGSCCSAHRVLRCGNVVVQGSNRRRCHDSSPVEEGWCGEKLDVVETIGWVELGMAV